MFIWFLFSSLCKSLGKCNIAWFERKYKNHGLHEFTNNWNVDIEYTRYCFFGLVRYHWYYIKEIYRYERWYIYMLVLECNLMEICAHVLKYYMFTFATKLFWLPCVFIDLLLISQLLQFNYLLHIIFSFMIRLLTRHDLTKFTI